MAEFVVHAQPKIRREGIGRTHAILDRVGRTRDRRSMDASFDFLVAAKSRYSIGRVTKHVCRHDEGIGDCKSVVEEG